MLRRDCDIPCNILEHLRDDVIGRNSLSLRLKVEDKPMPKDRVYDRLQIVETHIETSLCQGAHLSRQNHALCTSRAAAKAQILVCDRNCRIRFRMCGHY